MVKIIDDLLPQLYLNKLKYLLHGNPDKDINEKSKFNWFWNDFTSSDGKGNAMDNNFMFTHVIWNSGTKNQSPYFETFCPIVYFIAQHIPVKDVVRIKLNLYTNQNKRITHAKHTDVNNTKTSKPLENCNITVLNLTTCNGGTIIGDKEYISKANQAITFDNHTEHQGFTQTDTSRRIVINIATTH
jgi:hypothetical protein